MSSANLSMSNSHSQSAPNGRGFPTYPLQLNFSKPFNTENIIQVKKLSEKEVIVERVVFAILACIVTVCTLFLALISRDIRHIIEYGFDMKSPDGIQPSKLGNELKALLETQYDKKDTFTHFKTISGNGSFVFHTHPNILFIDKTHSYNRPSNINHLAKVLKEREADSPVKDVFIFTIPGDLCQKIEPREIYAIVLGKETNLLDDAAPHSLDQIEVTLRLKCKAFIDTFITNNLEKLKEKETIKGVKYLNTKNPQKCRFALPQLQKDFKLQPSTYFEIPLSETDLEEEPRNYLRFKENEIFKHIKPSIPFLNLSKTIKRTSLKSFEMPLPRKAGDYKTDLYNHDDMKEVISDLVKFIDSTGYTAFALEDLYFGYGSPNPTCLVSVHDWSNASFDLENKHKAFDALLKELDTEKTSHLKAVAEEAIQALRIESKQKSEKPNHDADVVESSNQNIEQTQTPDQPKELSEYDTLKLFVEKAFEDEFTKVPSQNLESDGEAKEFFVYSQQELPNVLFLFSDQKEIADNHFESLKFLAKHGIDISQFPTTYRFERDHCDVLAFQFKDSSKLEKAFKTAESSRKEAYNNLLDQSFGDFKEIFLSHFFGNNRETLLEGKKIEGVNYLPSSDGTRRFTIDGFKETFSSYALYGETIFKLYEDPKMLHEEANNHEKISREYISSNDLYYYQEQFKANIKEGFSTLTQCYNKVADVTRYDISDHFYKSPLQSLINHIILTGYTSFNKKDDLYLAHAMDTNSDLIPRISIHDFKTFPSSTEDKITALKALRGQFDEEDVKAFITDFCTKKGLTLDPPPKPVLTSKDKAGAIKLIKSHLKELASKTSIDGVEYGPARQNESATARFTITNDQNDSRTYSVYRIDPHNMRQRHNIIMFNHTNINYDQVGLMCASIISEKQIEFDGATFIVLEEQIETADKHPTLNPFTAMGESEANKSLKHYLKFLLDFIYSQGYTNPDGIECFHRSPATSQYRTLITDTTAFLERSEIRTEGGKEALSDVFFGKNGLAERYQDNKVIFEYIKTFAIEHEIPAEEVPIKNVTSHLKRNFEDFKDKQPLDGILYLPGDDQERSIVRFRITEGVLNTSTYEVYFNNPPILNEVKRRHGNSRILSEETFKIGKTEYVLLKLK